jgi:hypothetical protein
MYLDLPPAAIFLHPVFLLWLPFSPQSDHFYMLSVSFRLSHCIYPYKYSFFCSLGLLALPSDFPQMIFHIQLWALSSWGLFEVFCGRLYSLVVEVLHMVSQTHSNTLLGFCTQLRDSMMEGLFKEGLSCREIFTRGSGRIFDDSEHKAKALHLRFRS